MNDRLRAEVRERLRLEQGTLAPNGHHRIALTYPSPYRVGMASLGFQTIYREINGRRGWSCERVFLPDNPNKYRRCQQQPFTYESFTPLDRFAALAFSVAYELELPGVFTLLDLAGIPILAQDRRARDPLIVAGGPLTFSNPLPLGPFCDVVIWGEAEEAIHTLCDALEEGLSKVELLQALAKQPGFWVPSIDGEEFSELLKCSPDRLPAFSQIVTPESELANMFLVEAERGCSRGCTYCVMRRTTNGGMRLIDPERILKLVPQETPRVGLVGAAVSDHPRLVAILEALVNEGRGVGVSSLRPDRLSDALVAILKRGGARTLTTAADGASQRLRNQIQRKTQEEHLIRAAELCRRHRLERLKLYEMIGLPGETDDDLDELVRLTLELSRIVPVSLGIAPFVAKKRTPLDGVPFAGVKEVQRRLQKIRRGLQGCAEMRPTSAKWAWAEYQLAQGGIQAGLAALRAWQEGGGFSAWRRAFEAESKQPPFLSGFREGLWG
jgi:radical SAM superfamily enzyme YgiQ (UPF0313 family)